MKNLENFLKAVQDKVGQVQFSERLKAIDNFLLMELHIHLELPKIHYFSILPFVQP